MAANHMEEGIDVTTGARLVECVVVTPEETALQTPAQFIALPLFDGEIDILPGRAPLIGRLGYGEMRVVEGKKTLCYYVDGGFVQVADDTVSVLTNRAVKVDDLDPLEAEAELTAAQKKPSNTQELLEIRDHAVARARGQLWVARNKR